MADQRCPTCGKWNPPQLRTCRACGTELTPPVPEDPRELPGGAAPEDESEVPEWLSRIRAQAREEEAASGAPASDADWLGRLRQADVPWDDGPPEEEPPDWLKESAEGGPSGPPVAADAAPVAPPSQDQDWLAKLRDADRQQEPAPPPAEAAKAAVPDWLARIREQEAAGDADQEPAPAKTEPPVEAREEPPSRPLPPLVLPDMENFETRGTAPLRRGGTGSLGGTSPLRRGGTGSLGGTSPLRRGTGSLGAPATPPAPAVPPPVPPTPAAAPPAKKQPFDDDSLALARRQAQESKPSWLSELTGEDEPRPPAAPVDLPPPTPALILDGSTPAEEAFAGISAGSIEVPEWFSEVGPDESAAPPAGKPDLAPATLPAWLEAMRPVETFRSSVEIASEDEQVVEAAGPLAGLRGVLLAEPIVALPRTAPGGSVQLELTERHYAQAELIHRLIEDEERERPARAAHRTRLPMVRWAVGMALFLAVLLPTLFTFPAFPLPAFRPIELDVLVGLVSQAPVDRPALLIVDYEPGYVGELEAVAGPLIDQVMGRRIPIATLGTRPTSPPLADRLLRLHAANFDYAYGRDYIHLGYLPAGPTSIQAFASQPRQPLLNGYVGAEAQTGQPASLGWDAALVGPVQSLQDFSLVILVTSSADEARGWTEQSGPYLGGTALIMVTTAGAEPMVRPYYESARPQVHGLLSGEPAAVSYEVLNARPGAAMVRWNAFGSGMIVAEAAIGLGLLAGLAGIVLERRKS